MITAHTDTQNTEQPVVAVVEDISTDITWSAISQKYFNKSRSTRGLRWY